MHLVSNRPKILKGIYMDDWQTSKVTFHADSLEEFLEGVWSTRASAPSHGSGDYQMTRAKV